MRRQRGFTLIELLVVIAIIGILATLVVTQLGAAQIKARNASATSDITEAGKGIELFKADDNNGNNAVIAQKTAISGLLNVTAFANAAYDSLDGTTSVNWTNIFKGTTFYDPANAANTYGSGVNKTPAGTTYVYKYATEDAGATVGVRSAAVQAGNYTLDTTLNSAQGGNTNFWIHNGASNAANGSPVAP